MRLHFVLLFFCCFLVKAKDSTVPGIIEISAETETITVVVSRESLPCDVLELAPNQTQSIQSTSTVHLTKQKTTLPRFEGKRDRIYSGFAAVRENQQMGKVHFVDEFKNIAINHDTYPKAKSKKGLQVQMIEDALALGVKHAALNFDFGHMVALHPATNDFVWQMDGRTFHFRQGYIEHTDARVKALSDHGIVVTLILLNYENADEEQNKILLHPNYDKKCPQNLSAFNTKTDEGLGWFKACVEFLADRYSQKDFPHGHVANYIVGNEVNSHWWWANMGHVSVDEFADDYARTMRICNTAVSKYSPSARVFISLEHHWNIRYSAGDKTQSFPAHKFIDRFNEIIQASGDFDWNLAYHPYPENLFNPKTWEDKSATFAANTPRITFKNLEMMTDYFRRPALLFQGKPRHIILSEQGFHSDGTEKGEQLQAAAYCYAYYKTDHLNGIDAFILHRHVDHPAEGGLNLGLWRRNGESAEPLSKKPIYEVFRLADTPQWKDAFSFALPLIGLDSWRGISYRGQSKN